MHIIKKSSEIIKEEKSNFDFSDEKLENKIPCPLNKIYNDYEKQIFDNLVSLSKKNDTKEVQALMDKKLKEISEKNNENYIFLEMTLSEYFQNILASLENKFKKKDSEGKIKTIKLKMKNIDKMMGTIKGNKQR